jgi:hypothetical protein
MEETLVKIWKLKANFIQYNSAYLQLQILIIKLMYLKNCKLQNFLKIVFLLHKILLYLFLILTLLRTFPMNTLYKFCFTAINQEKSIFNMKKIKICIMYFKILECTR